MATTLISFVGTGQRDKNDKQGYLNTKYDFGDQQIIKSAIFFDAILLCEKFDIDKCILIGTKTSAWTTLLDRDLKSNGTYIELYEQIEQELKEGGISDATLAILGDALEKLWGRKCLCYANDAEITADNCFAIISDYFDLTSRETEQDIIIDITHGFRSMAVLLMTALQFKDSLGEAISNIQIIYGEYKSGISSVRYLYPVWDAIKISQASRLFFDKFEPRELSEYVKPFWPAGAKAITELGSAIQGNLVLVLDEALRQLQNALHKYENAKETFPKWSHSVVTNLAKLHKRLSSPPNNKARILVLAELFAERYLYGQAITTLRLSYEAFLFEYYDNVKYGDYDEIQKLARNFSHEEVLSSSDKDKTERLRKARNMIAHGGASSVGGGKPQPQNLPSQYKSYHKFLVDLYQKHS